MSPASLHGRRRIRKIGGLMKIIDPSTGAVLDDVPAADRATVADAVVRARTAQVGWAAGGVEPRRTAIRRFRALVETEAERLARVLAREVGKPIVQARSELAGVLPRIDFFLAEVDAALADGVVSERPVE